MSDRIDFADMPIEEERVLKLTMSRFSGMLLSRRLDSHLVASADSLIFEIAGKTRAASTAMIAMTTRSSMRVKAEHERRFNKGSGMQ
jgi:hypothetical protein